MNYPIIQRWTDLPTWATAKRLVGKGYDESTFSPDPVYPGHINHGGGYWHITGETHVMYTRQIAPGLVRYVLIQLPTAAQPK